MCLWRHSDVISRSRLAQRAAGIEDSTRSDAIAFEACQGERFQGRADGRGRRRDPGRIRHLQGDQDPAILGKGSSVTAAAAASETPLSIHGGHSTAVTGLPEEFLPRYSRGSGKSVFLPFTAMGINSEAEAVFFR